MLDSLLVSLLDHGLAATMKLDSARALDGFGTRLGEIRRARALFQEGLASQADVSRRVIASYETESAQRPGALLVALTKVLKVSTDELLGVKTVKELASPTTTRLINRLRRVEELPPADQRAVLKLVDPMIETRRRSAPPARAKRRAS